MNGPSKITADYSSIVGLKAELLRKRSEAREIKAKGSSQKISKTPKPKVKEKKSRGKDRSSPKVTEIEDINTLQKSKLMLEAKSRLYEKLKESRENGSDLFLVDFSKKPDELEKSDVDDDIGDEYYDSDDNFVEYKDCFGRTRKCLREDLPKMQEKDNLLKQQISKDPPPAEPVEEEKVEEPPQREPEIEIMRKKWEEQTERLAEKVNIHYQDVLFDEARAHGVGYYNFSIDEEERAKQQANLEKLRKETQQKQKEMQDLKEMRDKMEKNRLKVARIRQRIRAGLPPELPEEDENGPENDSKNSKDEEVENTNVGKEGESSEKKSAKESENSLSIIEDKVRAFGELLGKRTKWREMSQEEWVDKRRKDRNSEFAPTYQGFKSAGCIEFGNFVPEKRLEVPQEMDPPTDAVDLHQHSMDANSDIIGPFPMSIPLPPTPAASLIPGPPGSEEKDEESDDSDIIGPMPCTDAPEFIPLPPNPPPSMIPVPKESTPNSGVCSDDSKTKYNIDSDKIAAGLRFLREKFEKEKEGEN